MSHKKTISIITGKVLKSLPKLDCRYWNGKTDDCDDIIYQIKNTRDIREALTAGDVTWIIDNNEATYVNSLDPVLLELWKEIRPKMNVKRIRKDDDNDSQGSEIGDNKLVKCKFGMSCHFLDPKHKNHRYHMQHYYHEVSSYDKKEKVHSERKEYDFKPKLATKDVKKDNLVKSHKLEAIKVKEPEKSSDPVSSPTKHLEEKEDAWSRYGKRKREAFEGFANMYSYAQSNREQLEAIYKLEVAQWENWESFWSEMDVKDADNWLINDKKMKKMKTKIDEQAQTITLLSRGFESQFNMIKDLQGSNAIKTAEIGSMQQAIQQLRLELRMKADNTVPALEFGAFTFSPTAEKVVSGSEP